MAITGATQVQIPQKPSIAHTSTDPYRNYRFLVDINGMGTGFPNFYTGGVTMGFMAVSGLNVTTEVIPYRQGGQNTTTQKLPGQSDFAPITLSKGLAAGDSQMYAWMTHLFTVMQGNGTGGPTTDFRATVDIRVLDHPVTTATTPVVAWFRVYNAWVTSLSWSDLDAGANAVLVQQMTLAHEGFEFQISPSYGKPVAGPNAF